MIEMVNKVEHVNAGIIRTTIRAAAEILYAIADGKKVQYRYTTTDKSGTWKDFDAKSVEACSNVLTGYPNVEWRVALRQSRLGISRCLHLAGYLLK